MESMDLRGQIISRSLIQQRFVGKRFAFGDNWKSFLGTLDEDRIFSAEKSLSEKLEVSHLDGKTFLDIGSGSGLFSLAAYRLGATVYSFDYDAGSVACTNKLKLRYASRTHRWKIEQGSVLDLDYLKSLGRFDIVYSWGVLHHTGDMWRALENVSALVKPRGKLFIAIYNDQGQTSRLWMKIKRLYVSLPTALRWIILIPCFARLWLLPIIRNPKSWAQYKRDRGMSPWHDVVDWVGGYPFEVAMPEQIFRFYKKKGFELHHLKTCGGGIGCNEFILRKTYVHPQV